MIPAMSQPSTLQSFARWPWREALSTLRERFAQDRLGLTAGSLTFTTSLALVPFFTLVLAIFTVLESVGDQTVFWCVPNTPELSALSCSGALTALRSRRPGCR